MSIYNYVDVSDIVGDYEENEHDKMVKKAAEYRMCHCDFCDRELRPAESKLRADGEQTYVGFYPCACARPIMTDFGCVYPGTEDHEQLLNTGMFKTTDLLSPISWTKYKMVLEWRKNIKTKLENGE